MATRRRCGRATSSACSRATPNGAGFKWEQISASANDGGGVKESVFAVKGDGAYSVFKWEAGTHRVQRVPTTESQGRIHTSTATVAVMPEAEEVEVDIDQGDLKIDVYRSTGPGGQSVNTTDSAVRITHVPTGIVVAMQDERSQLKNRDKAMRVLRARLFEHERRLQQAEESAARRAQIGGGERAEKIRTYNFPENRLTDHRIKLTQHRLDAILEGDLDEFTAALDRRRAAPSTRSGMTIPELLRQWAEATPDAPALLAPGRQPLTYARLYDLTQALARQLRSLGVRPDDRVAIVAQNGPELAVSFLAVASTAVAAPLNPAYRVSELDFYLADLGAKAIIMDEPPSDVLRLLLRRRVVRLLELERSASGEAGGLSLSGGGRGRGKARRSWSDGARAPHLRDDGAAEARVAHTPARCACPRRTLHAHWS